MIMYINGINAQSLDFSEMDHVPEYDIRLPFRCTEGECWIIPNTLEDEKYLIASFNGSEYTRFDFETDVPTQFVEIAENIVLGRSRSGLYKFTAANVEEIEIVLANDEDIRSILPSRSDGIFLSTNRGLYRSIDNGDTFQNIEIWPFEWRLRNSIIANDVIYSLRDDVDNNISYIESRNKEGLLLNEKQLDIIPRNITIKEDQIYISENGQKSLLKMRLDFSDMQINTYSELGVFNEVYNYNDSIIIYSFRESLISYLNDVNAIEALSELSSTNPLNFANRQNNEFYVYSEAEILIPTSLLPLQFDTIIPDATATKINDLKTYKNNIYVQTDNAFYALEDNEWIERQQGGLRFEVDHAGNVLVDGPDTGPDEIWYSTDNAISFEKLPIDFTITTKMINYNDTTLVTGRQNCSEFNNASISGRTTDGSMTWDTDIIESPPCFEQRFTTITQDRVYVYDRDQSYALSPGNAIYSWFGYYDRVEKEFVMIEPDPTLPFVATSPNQFFNDNVSFYVSPDEIFYMNPFKDNVSGYHSLDRGETWIETADSPTGRIYPTPDSTGTIVIQNDPEGKLGTKFYVRYDVTQPYVEINVSPDLPPIEYLKYTSDGRMIVASETGYFYISDGITSTIDDVREAQTALNVYPNPVTDVLHIRSEYSINQVDVVDFNGRSIYVAKSSDSIDMSAWNTGVYLVSVVLNDGRRLTRKVVRM